MTRKQTKSARKVRLGCHLCRRGCRSFCRGGFTLVEVLVVTVIIGILLALVTMAVFPALQSAREFAISSEAGQLGMAIEAFKSHYGSGYPPADLAASGEVDPLYNFVRATFPRFTKDPSDPTGETDLTAVNLRNYLQTMKNEDGEVAGVYITTFDPGQALVFWLVGFSNDPSDPFDGHVARMRGKNLDKALYAFDPGRLGTRNEEDIWTVHYYPNLSGGVDSSTINSRAFLYFDQNAYGTAYDPDVVGAENGPLPEFAAYQSSAGTQPPYNPGSFQIINAGLDGQLGVGATTASDADADNIANFSGGTIADYIAD